MRITPHEKLIAELEKTVEQRRDNNGFTYDTTIPGTLIDLILARLNEDIATPEPRNP